MKKKIKQLRYYGDGHINTYPIELLKDNLVAGSYKYIPPSIIALGIQTSPGVKFYLNDSSDAVIVGASGIFEIDLNDNCEINFLHFDEKSIESIIENETYLILDIIYNEEE